MARTITKHELQAMGVDTWSVRDNSPRGYSTKFTQDVMAGDMVVIDNYFTTVTD